MHEQGESRDLRRGAVRPGVVNFDERKLRIVTEQRDAFARANGRSQVFKTHSTGITDAVDEEAILRTLLSALHELGFNRVHYFSRSQDELVPMAVYEAGVLHSLDADLAILPKASAIFSIIGSDPNEHYAGGVGHGYELDAPLHDCRGQYIIASVQKAGYDAVGYLIADDYAAGEIEDDLAQDVFALARQSGAMIFTQRSKAEISRLANTDALTGLFNRRRFIEELETAIARNLREQEGRFVAVVYFDMTGFKQINDTLGHEAGDRILVQFANVISDNIRDGDAVGRLGGDEFVALIIAKSLDEVEIATARLRAALRVQNLEASIGVAVFPRDAHDPDGLLKFADSEMYRDKRASKAQRVS